MIFHNVLKTIFICFILCIIFLTCKDAEKKIDANLKLNIKNLKETSRLDQNLYIVFKVNEDITDLHLQVLRKNKVKIIANIGNIYTASLPAKKVYNLAKLKFVEYIQGSKEKSATPIDSTKTIRRM